MNTSHVTEVMMQGAIQYIDQISNGSGATAMTTTRDTYVSDATSIQTMQNGTELRTADMGLMKLEHQFFNQTEVAMKTYNGTSAALKQSINTTLSAAGLSDIGCGPGFGHAPGLAGNETARPDHAPDFAGNETARPDHMPGFAGNETARPDHMPDFAGNETARPDHMPGFAGNGTACPDHMPDFAGNETARPDHMPGFAVNGTAHAGNVSSPTGNGGIIPGNGTVGRHNRGVNA